MDEERAWLEAALAGDKEAFSHLVEAYQGPVYNLAYRMLGNAVEAEDAAQETFLRAYTRLRTYQMGRKFSSWLLAIASHYCIDRLRRRRFVWLPWDELPSWRQPFDQESPERQVIQQEHRDEVRHLLQSLPPADRLAVVLRYWHDLSYQEIAELTETTESAVKARLHRARCKLAARLTAASPAGESGRRREGVTAGSADRAPQGRLMIHALSGSE